MIVYKVDKPTQVKTNAQIRDMAPVLAEIAPSLRILRDLLGEHQNSLSSQSIDYYREDLTDMVVEAIRLTHLIAVNAQRLSNISDQTAKQLSVLDEQIAAALQGRSTSDAAAAEKVSKTDATADSKQSNRVSFGKTLSRV